MLKAQRMLCHGGASVSWLGVEAGPGSAWVLGSTSEQQRNCK